MDASAADDLWSSLEERDSERIRQPRPPEEDHDERIHLRLEPAALPAPARVGEPSAARVARQKLERLFLE